MALPPKGDPRRPLHLAARSTRVLGIIFILIGCLASVSVIGVGVGSATRLIALVVPVVIFLGAGSGYLIVSIFLKRRAFWAVVTGLVIASIHAAIAVLGLAGMAITVIAPDRNVFIPIFVLVLWLAAMAQLIYHLSKSFAGLRLADEAFRGFEPLRVQPATPWPTSPLPSAPPTPASPTPTPSLQQERPHT